MFLVESLINLFIQSFLPILLQLIVAALTGDTTATV